MSSLRIGLTGGLASGKSTVARWLREAGFTVVDADELVAELYRPGGEGAAAVAALFGPSVLDASGAVDHRRVAERVFSDPEALSRLEAAVHPLVRRRFIEIAEAEEGVVVLEATRLVEAGYGDAFDTVVTVEADRSTRLERSLARGLSREQSEARLAAQGDGAERRAGAHLEISNDGTLEELRRRVDELVAAIRRRAAQRQAGQGDAR